MIVMHLFVSYAYVNLCHLFSSYSCRELAAASACGSSWTFLFTFLFTITPKFGWRFHLVEVLSVGY